jgi:hypothetical protein
MNQLLSNSPEYLIAIYIIFFGSILLLLRFISRTKRQSRRDYYINVYLKSDDWRRKRYVVLKRDNWRCVYCGAEATQVHRKRYARRHIGKEPIDWLVSVCSDCHESLHHIHANKKNKQNHRFILNRQTPIARRSNLQDWLKNNPGKTINDYFSKFGV